MPGPDPTHWLHRLTAAEWLSAAATELGHAQAAADRRARRPALTHARRAAGMAWNAVLVDHPDERAGRSYMDHLLALAKQPPDDLQRAAAALCETAATQPGLVQLKAPGDAPDREVLRAAQAILEHASRVVKGDSGLPLPTPP